MYGDSEGGYPHWTRLTPPVPAGWEKRTTGPIDARGWTLTYSVPSAVKGIRPGPRPVAPETRTPTIDPLTAPRPGAWANY